MKTLKLFVIGLLLASFITSCSSTKITYDKNIDFSQYKTYAYFKKGVKALRMPAPKKRLVLRAISDVLLEKGFSKSSHPDFIVNIFTDIHDRIDVYPGYYSPFYPAQRIEKSKEGTIYVDIVDLKTKRVIWSGRKNINYRSDDLKAIRKAVRKLLERFPPKP